VPKKWKKNVFFLLKYRGHLNGEGSKNANKQKPWSPIAHKKNSAQYFGPKLPFFSTFCGKTFF
jgi:hypothetical protein